MAESRSGARTQGEQVIAFVTFPGMTPLDLVGPLQVLTMIGEPFRVVTVGRDLGPVDTDMPLKLLPSHRFDEVPQPYAVMVPGGGIAAIRAMADDAIQGYLKAVAPQATIVGSVCTGSLILAAAGLLEGKRATTHWALMDWLAKLGARPVQERWVEDGKFISAAGVSAGIDWAIALTARIRGEDQARLAQIMIEYDPDPPLGWIDWDRRADFEQLSPIIEAELRDAPQALSARPDLIERLALGEPAVRGTRAR
jgi:transcriptional regulator GlxA family with amidase domain